MRLTTDALAKEILQAWFETSYRPNPIDDACLALVESLDRERLTVGRGDGTQPQGGA